MSTPWKHLTILREKPLEPPVLDALCPQDALPKAPPYPPDLVCKCPDCGATWTIMRFPNRPDFPRDVTFREFLLGEPDTRSYYGKVMWDEPTPGVGGYQWKIYTTMVGDLCYPCFSLTREWDGVNIFDSRVPPYVALWWRRGAVGNLLSVEESRHVSQEELDRVLKARTIRELFHRETPKDTPILVRCNHPDPDSCSWKGCPHAKTHLRDPQCGDGTRLCPWAGNVSPDAQCVPVPGGAQ